MKGWWTGYWDGAANFRELDGFPAERKRALWRFAHQGVWKDKLVVGAWLITIPLLVALHRLAEWLDRRGFQLDGISNDMVTMMVWAGLMGLLSWQAMAYVMQRRLWRMLSHLCSACGYDLTGNTSGVCPECGRAVERRGKITQNDS